LRISYFVIITVIGHKELVSGFVCWLVCLAACSEQIRGLL